MKQPELTENPNKYIAKYLLLLGLGKGAKIQHNMYCQCGCGRWQESQYTVEGTSWNLDPNDNHVISLKVSGGYFCGLGIFNTKTKEFFSVHNEDLNTDVPTIQIVKKHLGISDRVEARYSDEWTDFIMFNEWYIGEATLLEDNTMCMTFFDEPLLFTTEIDDDGVSSGKYKFETMQNCKNMTSIIFEKFVAHKETLDFESAWKRIEEIVGAKHYSR